MSGVSTDPRFLILVEGETEKAYFADLVRVLDLTDHVEIQVSKHNDPGLAFKALAQDMLWYERIGNIQYSEAWLVFDRDEHSGYAATMSLVDKFDNIHLAFSNPCFEFWLLMHYKTFSDLPFDKEILVERQVEVEKISSSFSRRVTTEIIEQITSAQTCFQTLKVKCPSYKKNASNYLDLFGQRLCIAYKRGLSFGSPVTGHGTGIPQLIDRLCSLANVTTHMLFKRLNPAYEMPVTVVNKKAETFETANEDSEEVRHKEDESTFQRAPLSFADDSPLKPIEGNLRLILPVALQILEKPYEAEWSEADFSPAFRKALDNAQSWLFQDLQPDLKVFDLNEFDQYIPERMRCLLDLCDREGTLNHDSQILLMQMLYVLTGFVSRVLLNSENQS